MIPYLKKRRLEDEDDHKININDIWDLRYWADRFGVIPEILQDAITSVGTESAEIREWLLAHGHIDATE